MKEYNRLFTTCVDESYEVINVVPVYEEMIMEIDKQHFIEYIRILDNFNFEASTKDCCDERIQIEILERKELI